MAAHRKKQNAAPEENPPETRPAVEKSIGAGHVDKIRDILFGNQIRDYDQKFSRLEDRLMNEVASLREESGKRFDALEKRINREFEFLSERLKAEQSDRTEVEKNLADTLANNTRLLEKKLADLNNRLSTGTRDLGRQLVNQSHTLSEEIDIKYKESRDALDRAAGELRTEKVDRSTLSDLLAELAQRLSEGSMPEVDPDEEAGRS